MYTQHLYEPNHLYDSNRFQDAEGQIKPDHLQMTEKDKKNLIVFIRKIKFSDFKWYDYFEIDSVTHITVDGVEKQISKIYIEKKSNNKYTFSIYLKESGDYVRIANNEEILNNDLKKTIISIIEARLVWMNVRKTYFKPYFKVSKLNYNPELLREYQESFIYKGNEPLPLNLEVTFNTKRFPSQILKLKIPYIYGEDALGYFLYCARQINNDKITNVQLIEKNEGYYGKFTGFDFTKKIDQTPGNSNSLSLELYKDGQKFLIIHVTLELDILHLDEEFKKIKTDENKMKYLYIQYYEILFEYIKEKIPEKIKDNHDRLKKKFIG
mgnify:CR=1 FL=1